jgi:hypothetical protein
MTYPTSVGIFLNFSNFLNFDLGIFMVKNKEFEYSYCGWNQNERGWNFQNVLIRPLWYAFLRHLESYYCILRWKNLIRGSFLQKNFRGQKNFESVAPPMVRSGYRNHTYFFIWPYYVVFSLWFSQVVDIWWSMVMRLYITLLTHEVHLEYWPNLHDHDSGQKNIHNNI